MSNGFLHKDIEKKRKEIIASLLSVIKVLEIEAFEMVDICEMDMHVKDANNEENLISTILQWK